MKITTTLPAVAALLLALTTAAPAGEKALPKLIDLGAKKCIPCKKMAPILEELKKDFADKFITDFIDVFQPENAEKAKAYKINLIPTQIFFDSTGKELWRHEGFLSKEDILKKWAELGVELETAATLEQ